MQSAGIEEVKGEKAKEECMSNNDKRFIKIGSIAIGCLAVGAVLMALLWNCDVFYGGIGITIDAESGGIAITIDAEYCVDYHITITNSASTVIVDEDITGEKTYMDLLPGIYTVDINGYSDLGWWIAAGSNTVEVFSGVTTDCLVVLEQF